jgi:hypothetical protein
LSQAVPPLELPIEMYMLIKQAKILRIGCMLKCSIDVQW